MKPYKMVIGPEGYFPAPVAKMGIVGPSPGEGLVMGKIVPEQQAIEEAATRLVEATNPTIHPGPLVLWNWNEKVSAEAKAVRALAAAVPARIIPMPDYRPKYPKVEPEIEINPMHPNLTIWKNKIDVCLFVGVHCHQANIALKIIRGGTSCFTIALCTFSGDDEAHLTIRDLTAQTIMRIAEAVANLKRKPSVQGNRSVRTPKSRHTGRA